METTLENLLLGGSIVTPKSGVLIQNIHTVEHKGGDTYLIGGEVITFGWSNVPKVTSRWTTIDLCE